VQEHLSGIWMDGHNHDVLPVCHVRPQLLRDERQVPPHWPLPQNLLLLHACCVAAVVKDGEEGLHSPLRIDPRLIWARGRRELRLPAGNHGISLGNQNP
jgi:hypothetical protein